MLSALGEGLGGNDESPSALDPNASDNEPTTNDQEVAPSLNCILFGDAMCATSCKGDNMQDGFCSEDMQCICITNFYLMKILP